MATSWPGLDVFRRSSGTGVSVIMAGWTWLVDDAWRRAGPASLQRGMNRWQDIPVADTSSTASIGHPRGVVDGHAARPPAGLTSADARSRALGKFWSSVPWMLEAAVAVEALLGNLVTSAGMGPLAGFQPLLLLELQQPGLHLPGAQKVRPGWKKGRLWTFSTSARRVARSIASSISGSRPTSPADQCRQAPERRCDRPGRDGFLSSSLPGRRQARHHSRRWTRPSAAESGLPSRSQRP